MKKISILAAAFMMVCSTAALAQVKIDVEGFQQKIAKSDADAANPKKNGKANMWLDRGKLFLEVADAPTMGAYDGMEEQAATVMFGKPKGGAQNKKIGDTQYRILNYANMRAYFVKVDDKNKLKAWVPTLKITDDPLGKAAEAYAKAYSLDKNTAAKVKEGQAKVSNAYRQEANTAISLQEYDKAAGALANAYDAVVNPPSSIIDTLSCFNAGFLFTASQKYTEGEKYLSKALEYGYEADGDTYFYLYHCYYFGLKDNEKAKDILLKGMAKYPENTRIVEGLMSVYTSGGGDPKDLIPAVQAAIDKDPKNIALISGLGRIYDKMDELDLSVQQFEKAAELMPKDYSANFNLGLLYIKQGDKANSKMNEQVWTDPVDFKAAQDKVNAVYAKALVPLEKAYNLKKNDPATLELLKNLTLRLQNEPGMREKYEKYNAEFQALPAAPAAQ